MRLNPKQIESICQATGASELREVASLQTLWSGYGEIVRIELVDAPWETAIVKHIVLPEEARHPAGWSTSRSHQRKLRSYQVETHWYQHWSQRCDEVCRAAACYGAWTHGEEQVLLLEDLDAAGFYVRKAACTKREVMVCLKWLAHFHATNMAESPEGLWPIGTYWHLATRPDELAAMDDPRLQAAAPALDHMLNECRYQTIVHGDAKVANFCFAKDARTVAAVDFQYVGGGCGIKDVIYLLGSCLDEDQCEAWEAELLHAYFQTLREALSARGRDDIDADALEAEWRKLYPVAWTDFTRFLVGWMPGHRKLNSYSERLAEETLRALGY